MSKTRSITLYSGWHLMSAYIVNNLTSFHGGILPFHPSLWLKSIQYNRWKSPLSVVRVKIPDSSMHWSLPITSPTIVSSGSQQTDHVSGFIQSVNKYRESNDQSAIETATIQCSDYLWFSVGRGSEFDHHFM